jgi:fused signal recognition particle receptor
MKYFKSKVDAGDKAPALENTTVDNLPPAEDPIAVAEREWAALMATAAGEAVADAEDLESDTRLDVAEVEPPINPIALAEQEWSKLIAEGDASVVEAGGPSPQRQEMGESGDQAAGGGFFSRLKEGLKRTGSGFADGMGTFLLGKKEIDDDVMEDLENALLVADVGIEATSEIVDNLSARIKRNELADGAAVVGALKVELARLLEPSDKPLVIDATHKPFVILVVGVNGVGKTTTIGKLARRYRDEGKSVMLAAGDTFRAAAVEQLQAWGERHGVPVVAQKTGSDSASVLYDALQAATARKIDVLIADTAGRLHNKDNLMDELKKVVRVMGKLDPGAPHETLLVLDAGTGQNALSQASAFQSVVNVSGLALTKLDGTAKGGIIFAICKQTGLPVRFIGVGEAAEDLRPFNAEEFVSALFDSH